MNTKTVKQLVRALCFALILVLLVTVLTFVTRDKNEAELVRLYYAEEENSLDVVFVGSSHMMCGIYPMELYHEYGITSYNFSSSALVLPQAYYQVVEALKTQTPEVLVLDISGVSYSNIKVGSPEFIHVQFDNMKWSRNKVEAINDLIEDPDDRLEYYFPLMKFHTRWKSLRPFDFQPLTGYTKGARFSETVLENPGAIEIVPEDFVVPIAEYPETYLRKILDYCRGQNVPVVLLNLPSLSDEAWQGTYNAVFEIAEEYGIAYLNLLYHLDAMGFDFTTDMRDTAHCNRSGAEKVSSYLGNYLKEHYELPDRRDDPAYAAAWDAAYEAYLSEYF